MILVESEPVLPHAVEELRAQVLLCLRANHALKDFDTVPDLVEFLEHEVLDGLEANGLPRALSRVVLFYRSAAAAREVGRRMFPGAHFTAYQSPACWRELGARLPELRQLANQLEPGWVQP